VRSRHLVFFWRQKKKKSAAKKNGRRKLTGDVESLEATAATTTSTFWTEQKNRVARWYIFKPEIPIWGKFWRVLRWKMLVNLWAICSILLPFGIHIF
jgi:hypothetical protein